MSIATQRPGRRSWRSCRAGIMPPQGLPRPDAAAYIGLRSWLEHQLDRAAFDHPNPGQPLVRRLTASEYINAIRDLLALPVDQRSLLFPPDDVDQHGFQSNGDVLSVSPALFERYLVAANRISRMAVGDATVGPGFTAATYSTPKLLYQDDRMDEDLPFGSRGGMVVRQYLPVDGEYGVQIVLRRQIYDYVVGNGYPAATRRASRRRSHQTFRGGGRRQ